MCAKRKLAFFSVSYGNGRRTPSIIRRCLKLAMSVDGRDYEGQRQTMSVKGRDCEGHQPPVF